jgi:CubicO group peptidase (beta-lactamase class C family)
MMNYKQIFSVFLFSLLIPALSKAQLVSSSDSIDVFIKQTMQKRQIPALQLAIIKQGKIVKQKSYGIANLENAIPATNESVFAINSITKAFVGVAIMQLAEEGKLKIEDPLSLYLDSLPLSWQKITLKQVLTHTSGLPDMVDASDELLAGGDEAKAWEMVKSLPLLSKPGEKFSYNQTGYVILGKIINKLSGMYFTKFIEEGQFKVAGMKLTRFGDSFDVVPNNAGAYTMFKNVGGQWIRNQSPGIAYMRWPIYYRTATSMMSTATEMASWILALQNGKLLKQKSSITTLWDPAVLNNGNIGGFDQLTNGYALGWPTVSRAEHPAVAPVGGGRSVLFIYPKDDLSIVVLTNLMGASPERIIDELAGYYIPEMHAANGFGLASAVKKLRTELLKQGFNKAEAVAASLKKKDPSFTLNENALNAWGYQLLSEKEAAKALSVFKLNTVLFPQSANAHDSLGEIQEIMGDKNAALVNYRKSLSLNPENKNAENRIKDLSRN